MVFYTPPTEYCCCPECMAPLEPSRFDEYLTFWKRWASWSARFSSTWGKEIG